jgi:hypothetical protein
MQAMIGTAGSAANGVGSAKHARPCAQPDASARDSSPVGTRADRRLP